MTQKRIAALLLAVLLTALSLPLTASARESGWDYPYSDSVDWDKFRGQNVTINVYNWGEYISVDDGDGGFDTNAEFEKLTGVKVQYSNFASNEELYAKMKSGGGAAYDIIIPSDYMIGRLIREGMLEELDFSNIPNFANIGDNYHGLEYDPEDKYSVAYTWGIFGLVYNTTLVDPDDDLTTWKILWNEKYAGNILMFSNSRDAFAIAQRLLGYSLNATDEKELRECAELLKEQKLLVQAYVMDEIYDKMGGGEAALAPYYAGDATVMIADNPDLAFIVPDEGTNLFVDAMCIPKGAKNKEAAELYINYMCEALTSKMNLEFIGYGNPNTAGMEIMDEDYLTDDIINQPEEVLENTEVYAALPETATKLMDSLWTEILSDVGANPWAMPILMLIMIGLMIGINVTRSQRKKRRELG